MNWGGPGGGRRGEGGEHTTAQADCLFLPAPCPVPPSIDASAAHPCLLLTYNSTACGQNIIRWAAKKKRQHRKISKQISHFSVSIIWKQSKKTEKNTGEKKQFKIPSLHNTPFFTQSSMTCELRHENSYPTHMNECKLLILLTTFPFMPPFLCKTVLSNCGLSVSPTSGFSILSRRSWKASNI